MRNAIFGDVHGNLDALRAVFADMDQHGIDRYYCLGDLVGYGAEPAAVVDQVRERADAIVAGNHDFAISGKLPLDRFNEFAREAAEWSAEQLEETHLKFLRELPLLETIDEFTIAHATLASPSEFNYIMNELQARENFDALETRIGFVGHSHIPMNLLERNELRFNSSSHLDLEEGLRLIVNVGSVGQPRDENPRASYGIYDDEENTIEIRRVKYDIDSAAGKIKAAGLPSLLGDRLYQGK